MTAADRNFKRLNIWLPFFSGLLILLYILWWFIFVYVPYSEKRDFLQDQIMAFEKETKQKESSLKRYKNVQTRLNASMTHIQAIRSGLPHLENFSKFMVHLKEWGLKHDLVIEEVISTSHLLPASYPSEILIHPVNLTLDLKGNFLVIGELIQYLDEEYRHFCHIRSVTMERSTSPNYNVLAQIKMEIFCQKQNGNILSERRRRR